MIPLMKKSTFRFPAIPRLEETGFWERCARRRGMLLLLFLLLLSGLLTGALLTAFLDPFAGRDPLPLFFSGIPQPQAGFFACFSTLLLNLLIFLTLSFLLGVTAFGSFAVPLLVLFKGVTAGLGVSAFLWTDGLSGWGKSAFSYTPAAAASLLLFLLFSLRALVFSDRLRRVSFSSCEEDLDFHDYWKDFLRFLCLAVAVSIPGGALAVLSSVFFP